MKHLLLTTIAAVVLVGCGESQQSAPAPETKPVEPIAEAAKPTTPPKAVSANKGADPARGVKAEPSTVKASDTSIHDAARDGNIEAVKQHLAAGTDVNAKFVDGTTPLHVAALAGRKEIAELLIIKGADVKAKVLTGQNKGMTPLDGAITFKQTETVDLLRKHGGKSGAEDSIHVAARLGSIQAVKQHIATGTDVNAKEEDGWTPLHYAAFKGSKEIVELLIAEGANVNAKNGIGYTPLHLAVVVGHDEIIDVLITNDTDVNAKTDDGRTALDLTYIKAIKDLLRKHGGKTGEELKAEGK